MENSNLKMRKEAFLAGYKLGRSDSEQGIFINHDLLVQQYLQDSKTSKESYMEELESA